MLRAARLGPLLARAARPALARAAPAARVLSTAVRTGKSASLDAVEDIDVDSVAYGFMASQALFTGLEVGVFEAIAAAGEGGLALAGLQKQCKMDAPRLQTLLTSLVSIKSLIRAADIEGALAQETTAAIGKMNAETLTRVGGPAVAKIFRERVLRDVASHEPKP